MHFYVTFRDLSTGKISDTSMRISAPNERALNPILAAATNDTGICVSDIQILRYAK